MSRLRTDLDVEQRAAEIVASIQHEYERGGWFAVMSPDEQVGWDLHDDEVFLPDCEEPSRIPTPENRRQMAGWLAAAIYEELRADYLARWEASRNKLLSSEWCETCGSSISVCLASRDELGTTQYRCHHPEE